MFPSITASIRVRALIKRRSSSGPTDTVGNAEIAKWNKGITSSRDVSRSASLSRCPARDERNRDSTRYWKIGAYSRKETRAGCDSSRWKECGGSAVFQKRMVNRTSGWTDERTDKQTNERKESEAEKPAGSATITWQRRIAHSRIYIHGAGATQRDSTTFGFLRPRSARPSAEHVTYYMLFAIRQTSARFRLLFSLSSRPFYTSSAVSVSRARLRSRPAITASYLGI